MFGLSTPKFIVLCCAVHVEYFDWVPGPYFHHKSDPDIFFEYFDGVPGSSFYHNSDPDIFFECFVRVPGQSLYHNADHDIFFEYFDGVPGPCFYHNSDPDMFFEYVLGVPRSSFLSQCGPRQFLRCAIHVWFVTNNKTWFCAVLYMRGLSTQKSMVLCRARHVWFVNTTLHGFVQCYTCLVCQHKT